MSVSPARCPCGLVSRRRPSPGASAGAGISQCCPMLMWVVLEPCALSSGTGWGWCHSALTLSLIHISEPTRH
eukprot:6453631-Karenia_brevis.AAC.1